MNARDTARESQGRICCFLFAGAFMPDFDMLRVDLYFMFTLESNFLAGLIRRRLKVDLLCG
jgi:hypothetical protein